MTKSDISSRIMLVVLSIVSLLTTTSCDTNSNNGNLTEQPETRDQGTQDTPFEIDLRTNNEFTGYVEASSYYSLRLLESGAYDISLFFVANTRLQMSAYDADSSAEVGVSCADYDFPDFDCSIKGIFTLVDGTPIINIVVDNLEQKDTAKSREFTVTVKRVQGELKFNLPLNETLLLGFSEQVYSSHYQLLTSTEGIYHVIVSAQEIDTDFAVIFNSITPNATFELYSPSSNGICEGNPLSGLDCEYYLSSDSEFDITIYRLNVDSYLPIEFNLEVVSP